MTDEYPLDDSQQRAWLAFMRVYHRVEYEMNRQLQHDCGLSSGDYTVLNALSQAPQHRLQLTTLARIIGWERSRLSHHLVRMAGRRLIDRVACETDRRGTDVILTDSGWQVLRRAAPMHAAFVRRAFFSDLDATQEAILTEVLGTVYGTLLREGSLPLPDAP